MPGYSVLEAHPIVAYLAKHQRIGRIEMNLARAAPRAKTSPKVAVAFKGSSKRESIESSVVSMIL